MINCVKLSSEYPVCKWFHFGIIFWIGGLLQRYYFYWEFIGIIMDQGIELWLHFFGTGILTEIMKINIALNSPSFNIRIWEELVHMFLILAMITILCCVDALLNLEYYVFCVVGSHLIVEAQFLIFIDVRTKNVELIPWMVPLFLLLTITKILQWALPCRNGRVIPIDLLLIAINDPGLVDLDVLCAHVSL